MKFLESRDRFMGSVLVEMNHKERMGWFWSRHIIVPPFMLGNYFQSHLLKERESEKNNA